MKNCICGTPVVKTRLLIMLLLSLTIVSCDHSSEEDFIYQENNVSKENYIMEINKNFVDLGLSSRLMWAECNVGALNNYDYGYYFAWGDIRGYSYDAKQTFDWSTYCLSNGLYLTKYCNDKECGKVDNLITIETADDVVQIYYNDTTKNANWRIPTERDFSELMKECKWTWEKRNNVSGYLVVGPNGNSIFLPAANFVNKNSEISPNHFGYYWSSTLNEGNCQFAYFLYFDSEKISVSDRERYSRHSIRPVAELIK